MAGDDFDALWSAAEATARSLLLPLDRRDRRGGLLVTEPTTSSQFFEPWRQDQQTLYDRAQSSLATIRRTVRFEFTRNEEGGYLVAPKVLVERYSQAENRISSVVLYRSAFRAARLQENAPYGTRETDRGVFLPTRYWYAIGRDRPTEEYIARELRKRLGASQG
ncbi:MAG: hypothetical protein NZ561_12980 [Phycisphaerae bacterium]|nr:hypothetical protein [Phycisphaerae bacterium]MDW8262111.1 hypothetical protein [Phycisphaerales bacterium]